MTVVTAARESPWRVAPGARSASLHNIANVDAFVWDAIGKLRDRRSGMSRDELEDWHQSGKEALGDAAERWDGRGNFAAFASQRLRWRLITAWHEIKGHRSVTRDGVRGFEPGPALVSLDALRDQGRDDVAGVVAASEGVAPFELRLREALRRELPSGFDDVLELCARVGQLFSQGFGEREVAAELDVSVGVVREARRGPLANAAVELAG